MPLAHRNQARYVRGGDARLKLTYWHGETPNFGDELNPWLWSRLLPGFFDDNDDTLFIGIGSILFDYYPATAKKIVFGSGYGAYTPPPTTDDSWTFYFVRGPRTAEVVGIDPRLGIGDGAILASTLPEVRALPRGTQGPAYIPHWESAIDGAWEAAATAAGLRFIDPRWDIERVLSEIASSSVVVTEAMHGAIVADALRVPWIPFAPMEQHRMKWRDWSEALDMTVTFEPSSPSTLLEAALRRFDADRPMQRRLRYHGHRHDLSRIDGWFVGRAAAALRRAVRQPPRLSSDAAIEGAAGGMLAQLDRLRRDYPDRLATLAAH